jgi:hypothetical protein
MYKPQYIDRTRLLVANESPSLWERFLGYKPRYVTQPDRGVIAVDVKQAGGRRVRRSPGK